MRQLPSTVINSMEDLFRDFNRFAIGFEPMMARVTSNPATYPPYNLIHDSGVYKLELAVAGFKLSELDINITNDRILSVKGRKNDEQVERNWIHRGIAARDFERQFTLAEHIKVISAKLEDGLLIIDLLREVPEPAKGINIPITTSNVVDVNVDPDQV